MEIAEIITNERLTEALRGHTDLRVSVEIDGVKIEHLRPVGSRQWFEYHCNESHDSGDAQVWYRSHQQCEVLRIADCDPVFFTGFRERADAGHQLLYRVRFDDGLEWDVFEDELVDSPADFCRPDPPKPLETT